MELKAAFFMKLSSKQSFTMPYSRTIMALILCQRRKEHLKIFRAIIYFEERTTMKEAVRACFVIFSLSCATQGFSEGYGMAGCGLGSVVWGKNNQISAATTNDSSASQPFGITSGTSNCTAHNQVSMVDVQKEFISDNFETLSKEIAQGNGESLKAFASTFGCKDSAVSEFGIQLQKSHQKIFASPGSQAALDIVREEILSNKSLSQSCPSAIL